MDMYFPVFSRDVINNQVTPHGRAGENGSVC